MIDSPGPVALRLSSTPLTAVDLAGETEGGDAIDNALRSGQATLNQLWDAFAACPDRPGNQRRAQLLRDSRDRPWSRAERRLHRLLRRHRITGWVTNYPVHLPNGSDYSPDVLFRSCKVIVEFDGYAFHSDRHSFNADRLRRNELELAGYLVLNFTWQQLTERPDWVISCIRRALTIRG